MAIHYHKVPKSKRTGSRQKYELTKNYIVQTNIKPGKICILMGYTVLFPDGMLGILKDYRWDGASFIAIDTKDFMQASLCHDALYQLMREGKLDRKYRKAADKLMYKLCVEDGMWKIRAWWCYQFVRMFAGKCARHKK